MSAKLGKDSVLVLHELAMRAESEEEYVVGRTDVGVFVAIPRVGWEALELIRAGHTIRSAESLLAERYGEPVDVQSFVEELTDEYPFVYRIDGRIVHDRASGREPFARLPGRCGRLLFHTPAAFAVYAIAAAFVPAAYVWRPSLLPRTDDFFATSSPAWNVLAAIALCWLLLALHETAHLLAARSLGVRCRFGVGHRLLFPVALTDMSGIVLVPHRLRYAAYLAGMFTDVALLAAGTALLVLHDAGALPLGETGNRIVRMAAFHLLQLLLFQFLFFMKTDLYYVFTTFCRCDRLLEHTRLRIAVLFRRRDDRLRESWANVPAREKTIIAGYVWFYVIGVAAALAWVGLVQLPIALRFILDTARSLEGFPLLSAHAAVRVMLLAACLLPFSVLIGSWCRSIVRRKGGDAT
ncbi:M50 family metallopeptidase [Paenibacillus flagellatus]|uniref:Uncharacterized protein n=1 Tax=Paenibacillus flagellatus TaxID=2211139 RepID=A0A2V5KUU5_9BACL|nr:M50 family metallopeptidase [Paenibacillus flagellatus]PYI55767.1 hypothetical protein DLM86_08595 [Paenibacillus flagellatus]